jgi:hypothetical protein
LLAASRDSFFGFLNLILVSGTCCASLRDQQGRLIDPIVRVCAKLLRVADRVWLGDLRVLPTGGERDRSLSHRRLESAPCQRSYKPSLSGRDLRDKILALPIKIQPWRTSNIAFLHHALMRLLHAFDAILPFTAFVGKLADDFVIPFSCSGADAVAEANQLPRLKLMCHVFL